MDIIKTIDYARSIRNARHFIGRTFQENINSWMVYHENRWRIASKVFGFFCLDGRCD